MSFKEMTGENYFESITGGSITDKVKSFFPSDFSARLIIFLIAITIVFALVKMHSNKEQKEPEKQQ